MVLTGKIVVRDVPIVQYASFGTRMVKRVFLIPDEESRQLLIDKHLESCITIDIYDDSKDEFIPLYLTTRNYSRACASPMYSVKYVKDNFNNCTVKLSVEVRANVVHDMVKVSLEYDPKSIEITGEKLYLVYSWRGDIRSKTGKLGSNGIFIPDDTSNGYPYHTNVPKKLMTLESGRILCYEKDLPEAIDILLKHKEEYLKELEDRRNKVAEALSSESFLFEDKKDDSNDISFLINTINAWEGKYRCLGMNKESKACHAAIVTIEALMEE